MTLSDTDLDARLRAAGALLDEQADERVAARERRRSGDRRPVLAAAVLVVLALAGVAVVVTRGGDDGTRVDTGTTTTPTTDRSPTTSTTTEVSPEAISALGGTGVIITLDGLVDLATGETTPLVTANNPLSASPVGVPDGAGGAYYLSHDEEADPVDEDDFGRMDLRHLGADGTDEVIEPGVRSFARRADGALAVAVPLEPIIRNGGPWLTRIEVVAPDGSRTTWTTEAGEYGVTAWAGERLLVERGIDETEAHDVLVLDGPDEIRVLSSYANLGAIGPDGTWVILSGLEPGESVEHDVAPPPSPPRVLDLASGETIGTVDMGDRTMGFFSLTWDGDDRLVAATSTTGPPHLGLVVELSVRPGGDGTVTVQETRTRELDPRTFSPDVAWAGPDGTIMALAPTSDQRYQARLYLCPADGSACALHELPVADYGRRDRFTNPSRPAPGG
ncbi:MAG TPA: hypothetical protein VK507_07705 [Iamia sp.]|nr:hypothetical protein [Iamia sp.]